MYLFGQFNLFSHIYSSYLLAANYSEVTLPDSVGNIIDFLLTIGGYIGGVLTIIGVFLFYMALKDDNANEQTRAIKFVVIGCACMGLRLILTTAGLIFE